MSFFYSSTVQTARGHKDNKNDNSSYGNSTIPNKDGAGVLQVPPSGQIVTQKLKVFTFAELKIATGNFRPDTLLGEGGFGKVFKGWVSEETYAPSKPGIGTPIAVKKLCIEGLQGSEEWKVNKLAYYPFASIQRSKIMNLLTLEHSFSEDINQYYALYNFWYA